MEDGRRGFFLKEMEFAYGVKERERVLWKKKDSIEGGKDFIEGERLHIGGTDRKLDGDDQSTIDGFNFSPKENRKL